MSAKVFQIPLIQVTKTFKLHAIVQRTPKPDDDAAKDHPGVKIYRKTEEILTDPEIDVIVVGTTPDTHFSLTKTALENGKHVMVEKPLVPTSGEAQQLIEIAKKCQRLVCVYQNRRWDSDFLTFRKLQKEGTLGRIVEFETHFDRWKPEPAPTWKGQLPMAKAGGVIYDLGTHLLDQAFVAFGAPEKVTGFFLNQRDDGAEDPDGFTILLHYPHGLTVTAKAGVFHSDPKMLRYLVKGTKGTYTKYYLDVQEPHLIAGMKPGDPGYGIEEEEKSGTLTLEGSNGFETSVFKNVVPETYSQIYSKFAEAIEKGDEELIPVKLSEAVQVLKIIETAKESAKVGKTLPF